MHLKKLKMNTQKLLSCPFCGEIPTLSEPSPRDENRYYVCLPSCYCHDMEIHCGNFTMSKEEMKETAVKDWNTRAVPITAEEQPTKQQLRKEGDAEMERGTYTPRNQQLTSPDEASNPPVGENHKKCSDELALQLQSTEGRPVKCVGFDEIIAKHFPDPSADLELLHRIVDELHEEKAKWFTELGEKEEIKRLLKIEDTLRSRIKTLLSQKETWATDLERLRAENINLHSKIKELQNPSE